MGNASLKPPQSVGKAWGELLFGETGLNREVIVHSWGTIRRIGPYGVGAQVRRGCRVRGWKRARLGRFFGETETGGLKLFAALGQGA